MASTNVPTPPPISHVLETCLYVKSMPRAIDFYKHRLGLKPYLETARSNLCIRSGTDNTSPVQLGMTTRDVVTPRGTIPHHAPTQQILDLLSAKAEESSDTSDTDATGTKTQSLQQHYCLAVDKKDDVLRWEDYLKAKDVTILSTFDWEKGGRSVYFTDYDGHIGEIGSRGIWDHF